LACFFLGVLLYLDNFSTVALFFPPFPLILHEPGGFLFLPARVQTHIPSHGVILFFEDSSDSPPPRLLGLAYASWAFWLVRTPFSTLFFSGAPLSRVIFCSFAKIVCKTLFDYLCHRGGDPPPGMNGFLGSDELLPNSPTHAPEGALATPASSKFPTPHRVLLPALFQNILFSMGP